MPSTYWPPGAARHEPLGRSRPGPPIVSIDRLVADRCTFVRVGHEPSPRTVVVERPASARDLTSSPRSDIDEEPSIRTLLAPVLALVLALALSACGTWDPTNRAEETAPATAPEGEAVEAGTMRLTVGDKTYSFSVDTCYASPEDAIEVRGTTTSGEQINIDYDADAPRERTIQVVNQDGTVILDGNAADGMEEPNLTIEEGGFSGTATFRSTDESMVGGELSGTC